jgi:hypothetical protein
VDTSRPIPNVSKDREKYFNWEAIRLPRVAEAPRGEDCVSAQLPEPSGINVTDLSVFKKFPLWGDQRSLQLRVEMFNIFNHAQFSDMNRNVQWANFDAYLAQRQAGSANINNVRGATLAGNPRLGNGVAEVNAPPRGRFELSCHSARRSRSTSKPS